MARTPVGRKTFAEPLTVPVVEDDLDAVKLISAILGQFNDEDKDRIIRWVMEKFRMTGAAPDTAAQIVQVASAPSPIILSKAANFRNPHLMGKPPLNKIMVQDDDEDGEFLGIPGDPTTPDPPEADILKPVIEHRRLTKVVDVHKGSDGKIVKSTSALVR